MLQTDEKGKEKVLSTYSIKNSLQDLEDGGNIGATTKPGVLKRLELDRVKHINVSSRPVSTGE